MIKFIDEKGTIYLVQAEIQTSNGVSGERSITGEIYTNDTVIQSIGRGWKIEFEDEFYCITYALPVDDSKHVVVEFDAVHQFFFDFEKSIIYEELNGSHTFDYYLDFIFKNSGYLYRNDLQVSALEKESFGMKNRLELFKSLINSVGVEYTVSGKVVRIVKEVGTDLSTVVRKGFNLQELRLEHNIGDFITYKRGYGAFFDSEDESKGRLMVEYKSPLADVYGILEGDPIVDERYTISDNLKTRLKSDVDNSYSVSVDLSMEDLLSAGYEQERPQAGDYIMAINEDVGFKEKVRIVSFTSSYSVSGELIDHQITCNSMSMASRQNKSDKYWKADVESNLESAVNKANQAYVSANGKNTTFTGLFGPDGKGEPKATKVGDIWYKPNGEETEMYRWDGQAWQLVISTKDNKVIEKKIDELETITDQAQKNSEKALVDAENARKDAEQAFADSEKTRKNSEKALIDAEIARKDAETAANEAFNSNAIANSAKSDAASASASANQALTDSNTAIKDAKDALYKYENLDIGARNFVPGTNTNDGWKGTGNESEYKWFSSGGYGGRGYWEFYGLGSEAGVYRKITFPSGTYTLSAWIYVIKPGDIVLGPDFPSFGYGIFTTGEILSKWTKIKLTFKSNGVINFPFNIINKGTAKFRISSINLEVGNVATDWSPAPEDVQVEITNLNNELTTKVSQTTYDTLKRTVDTQGTQITQNKNEIKLKASQSSVDTINQTVKSQGTQIGLNTDSIKLKANKTDVDKIGGRVTQVESSLSVQAGQITAISTKTDGNTTQIGKLQSSYDGLTSTVSSVKTDLDNLNVGARNYILNSSLTTLESANSFGLSGSIIRTFKDTYTNLSKTSSAGRVFMFRHIDVSAFEFAKYITMSMDVRVNKVTDGNANIFIRLFNSKGTNFVDACSIQFNHLKAGEWVRATATFELSKGSYVPIDFNHKAQLSIALAQPGDNVDLKNWKLESGNVATDWSPAPEDMASASEFSTFQQTVKGFQTTVNSDITGLKSQQTQMAGQITSLVSDNKNNKSQITQLSSQVTSLVSDNKDNKSQITQLSNQVTTTVTDVSGLKSQQAQMAGQISSTIAQVENLDVGAANLIVGSNDNDSWHSNGGLETDYDWYPDGGYKDKGYWRFYGTGKLVNLYKYITLSPGTYTISAWVYVSTPGDIEIGFSYNNQSIKHTGPTTPQWVRLKQTFSSHGVTNGTFWIISQGSAVFRLSSIKLESGNVATDWSPAPEDMASASEFSTFQQTVKGFQTTVNSDISGLKSQQTQMAGQITSLVSDNKNNKSQITQLSNNISLKVDKNKVVSQINISPETIRIDAKFIRLSGTSLIDNAVIKDANIASLGASKLTAGTIDASKINVLNLNASNMTTGTLSTIKITGPSLSMDLSTGQVDFKKGRVGSDNCYWDLSNSTFSLYDKYLNDTFINISPSSLKLKGYNGRSYLGKVSIDTRGWRYTDSWSSEYISSIEPGIQKNGSLGYGSLNLYTYFVSSSGSRTLGAYMMLSSSPGGVKNGLLSIGASATISSNCTVNNNLYVNGSKNAIHITRDGVRATPAYETAESYLGDLGFGKTDESGLATVAIDELFYDIANTDIDYLVFLQMESDGYIFVKSKEPNSFTVQSSVPNSSFAYEIKAKRRGYESDRLVIQKDYSLNDEEQIKRFS